MGSVRKKCCALSRGAGWYETERTGAHVQLRHPERSGKVTVPVHRGRTLDIKLVRRILAQAGLEPDQFEALLEEPAMQREYTVVLERCEDEPGFIATVPALPGCITQGDTLEEVLANIEDAICLWIRDGLAHGETIPRDEDAVRRVSVAVDGPA